MCWLGRHDYKSSGKKFVKGGRDKLVKFINNTVKCVKIGYFLVIHSKLFISLGILMNIPVDIMFIGHFYFKGNLEILGRVRYVLFYYARRDSPKTHIFVKKYFFVFL